MSLRVAQGLVVLPRRIAEARGSVHDHSVRTELVSQPHLALTEAEGGTRPVALEVLELRLRRKDPMASEAGHLEVGRQEPVGGLAWAEAALELWHHQCRRHTRRPPRHA